MKHNVSSFAQMITLSDDEIVQQRKATVTFKWRLVFTDGSVLHIRENVVRDTLWIDYSYHWQTADHKLIHRWDNAHPVDLPTSPHHQHAGSEENVISSEPMTLEKVLTYISSRLLLQ